MQENNFRFYKFGEFVLDSKRRVLFKNDREIRLTPRHFDLLFFLVRNEGRLLEHDELLDKVWEGMFVEQSNLKKGISALRQILEETPDQSFYIKTIPRRGYSFIAPVSPFAERLPAAEIEKINEENVLSEPTAQTGEITSPFDSQEEVSNANLQQPVPGNASERRNLRPFLITALAIIFLSVLAITGWKYFARNASAIDFSRMQLSPLTTSGKAVGGGISRNGENLFFITTERGGNSVWVKNLKTGKITPALKSQKASVYAATFAPDGESLYFWLFYHDEPLRNGIYKFDLKGDEPQKISDKNTGLVFSPDGRRVAYILSNINEQGNFGLFTANADLTDEKLIFNPDKANLVIQNFDWSPDGRFITYVARTTKNDRREFYIAQVPSTGGAEQLILPPRAQIISSVVWFPDGKGLAVIAPDPNTQFSQIWYLSYPGGEWRRITNDLSNYGLVSVNSDGNSIVVRQQRDTINLWAGQTDGQNFRQITFDTHRYHNNCGWRNDEMVLYATITGDNYEIWAMSADGANRRQLTFEPKNDYSPQASPVGKKIFFISTRNGGIAQVWQMDTDGGNPKQITNSSVEVLDFRILPDGQTLIYQVWLPAQNSVLFKKTIDGSDIKQLSFPDPFDWDISPDGKTIAYAAGTNNGVKIRLSPLEENKPFKEFDFGNYDNFVWTKDGKALLFDRHENDGDEIMIQPIDGKAKQLTNFSSDENIWNFGVSPSGRQIIARRVKQFFDIMLIKLDSD